MQGLLGMTIQGEFDDSLCSFINFSTLLLAFYLLFYLCKFLGYLTNKLYIFSVCASYDLAHYLYIFTSYALQYYTLIYRNNLLKTCSKCVNFLF